MTPEERIRMLLMGRAWGLDQEMPVPTENPAGESVPDVFLNPPPSVRLPPMYAGGREYRGLRPDTVMPETYYPEEMVDTVSFEPPSVRERTAAALQKRRQMRGM